MRVTSNVLINNLKRNLSSNIRIMEKIQNQLATGKRISKPSDDPTGVVDSLRLSTRLRENRQYQENAGDALSLLTTADEALGSLSIALRRVYELTVYGANDTLTDEDRKNISEEVKQIIEEVKTIANATHSDKYIFGGTNTTVPPYDGVTPWNDNTGTISYEISRGIVIPVNITAQEVFREQDMFTVLENIAQHLDDGDIEALSGADLTAIQVNIDQVLTCRAQVGARVNRLELVMNRLKDQELNFSNLQAEVDGVDPAEVIIRMTNQENVYKAALAVGGRIIMPTLVDFIR